MPPANRIGPALAAPSVASLACLALLTVFAGPVMRHMESTAAQLYDPGDYVAAVLEDQHDTKKLKEEEH